MVSVPNSLECCINELFFRTGGADMLHVRLDLPGRTCHMLATVV